MEQHRKRDETITIEVGAIAKVGNPGHVGELQQQFTVGGKRIIWAKHTDGAGSFTLEDTLKINYIIEDEKKGRVMKVGTIRTLEGCTLDENSRNKMAATFVVPLLNHLKEKNIDNLADYELPHRIRSVLRS